MAASVIYAGAALRADARVVEQNRRGQSGLWGFGISGDWPVVLLWMTDAGRIELVRQMVQAHAYWRAHGIETELAIISAQPDGGEPGLVETIRQSVDASAGADRVDKPGGIFVRDSASLDDGDRILLQSVARVVITDAAGMLAEQLERRGSVTNASGVRATARMPVGSPAAVEMGRGNVAPPIATSCPQARDLFAFNGLGGFTSDGSEYVITTSTARMTPAPWVNVLANPEFGTLGVGERKRDDVERERARVPPDAVVQRSGGRRQHGGALHPRRSDRPLLVADLAPGARRGPVCHAPRLRLQHLRTCRGRHRIGAMRVRRDRRSGQVLGADAAQPLESTVGACP